MSKLTSKQERFCHFYGHHENAALAARQAGYSAKTSSVKGSQLLAMPKIRKICDELIQKRMEKLEITGEKILAELAKIAFTDATAIVGVSDGMMSVEDFDALTPEQRACIASVKRTSEGVEIKLYDKLSALEKLGKNQKLFTDVHEQKHTFSKMGDIKLLDEQGNTVPLEFDIGKEPDEVVH